MPRRPPHFKIFTTVRCDPKMPRLWASDALLAMYVRAGVLSVERFADRTHDSCLVNRKDLMDVAATQPMVNAIRKLRSLTAATPLRLRCDCAGPPLDGRCDCAGIWLDFPNFAKWQGFKGENGTETEAKRVSSSSASSSALSPPKTTEKEEPPKPPSQGGTALELDAPRRRTRKRREPRPETDPPESYTDDELAKLRSWCERTPDVRGQAGRVAALSEACLIHHRKKGLRSCDWYASAQTWIRNDVRFNPAPPAAPAAPAPLTAEERLARYSRVPPEPVRSYR